eukprot:CAMPEP_0183715154 /NCGR_PEP_ID=MMETSP0737-20130205/9496_1 /TAXON_ID=385413 /ORGANISM="Thalassiosira miniscula, Strain CCMP1093" /LENGTH=144 /DNA_ID=CAMNT_0025944231 /DNA_START=521 /DNA_END=955 /DNA_ORIENTATION=-
MEEARAKGFKHVVFDDNYPPGHGDNTSGKKLCDPQLWSFLGKDDQYSYQDDFGHVERPLSSSEYLEYVERFRNAVSIYSEFPPIWDGPSRFFENGIARQVALPPLFSRKELTNDLGLDENSMASNSFDEESRRYTYINYARLAD